MQKLNTTLICLFLLFFISTTYGQWSVVGSAKFTNTDVIDPAIRVSNGTPYIGYVDFTNGAQIILKKFDGTNWVDVGNHSSFTAGSFKFSFDIDNGIPYLAFLDQANSQRLTVIKYDGTSWVLVGNAGFTEQDNTKIKVKNGIPYVAFRQFSLGSKETVMKYDGTNWVLVGNAGFTSGSVNRIAFDVDNGTPYVLIENIATVMKYNGTNWVTVGSGKFTQNQAFNATLKLNNGTPYVAYNDIDNGRKPTVMKYDGTNWVNVGSSGISGGVDSKIGLNVINDIPYVGFSDNTNGKKGTVRKYDGTNWVTVGTSSFTAGIAAEINLAFSVNSNLAKINSANGGNSIKVYAVFQDGGASNFPLTVMVHTSSASITGRKFEDKNSNGVQDTDEPGLVNWQIICDQDTVKTDSLGNYVFTSLPPGLHKVSEVEQSGWTRTLPADTNNYDIVLPANVQVDSVNFGNHFDIPTGNIAGIKYWDKNGNGIIDLNRTPIDSNDVPLAGWTIKLSTGDSTITDATGHFIFKDLPVGQYGVNEIQKPDWVQTIPSETSGYQIAVMENETDSSSIFANKKLTGTIIGKKYWDKNGNGIIDSNDVPLAGFTIKLSTGATAVTDSLGQFTFDGLTTGQYGVSEVPKKGWEQTLPANNGTYQIPIFAPQIDTTSIFANKPLPAVIMGVKFNDLDSSFSKTVGDSLMAGWTIKALYNGKTVEVVTDSTGKYTIFINFDKTLSISVNVDEVQKGGWVKYFPIILFNSYDLNVNPGDTLIDKDFGNIFFGGTIKGRKFQDNNGNGIQDSKISAIPNSIEFNLSGWTINLSNGSTTITNEEGKYTFERLPPGTYFVSEVSQPNWTQTTPKNIVEQTVEITDREIFTIIFGNKPDPGTIFGMLFNDDNMNGVLDANEDPLVGWKVFLNSTSFFTTTDALGNYEFTNLFPGDYLVFLDDSTGWNIAKTQLFKLLPGETVVVNFGNTLIKETIFGKVDIIKSSNGAKNWLVELDGGMQIETDENGFFKFKVEPGFIYNIKLIVKPGWEPVNGVIRSIFVPFGDAPRRANFTVKPKAGFIEGLLNKIGLGKISNKTKQLLKITGTNGLPPTPIPVSLEILAQENNVVYDTLIFIDTTDALGNFSFDLPFGSYTLKPLLPPGWKYDAVSDTMFTGSIDTIGTTVSNVSFTVTPPATITGQKFLDLNRNGVQDPTEVGLDSVVIQLFDNSNNLLQTQTTHSIEINGDSTINPVTESGLFVLQPLTAGTYVVKEQVPIGWSQSFPVSSNSYTVVLADGQIVDSVIFGNKLPDSLDYGDLPVPYKSLLLQNGPKHKLGAYTLGPVIDSEPDGQPQVVAIGDDQTGSVNDEDGIVFTDQLVAGSVVNMQVTVQTPAGQSGFLNGWIDYNQDGILDTTAEHIFRDTTLSTGTHTLSYSVSATALKGGTFARFRFSDTAGLLPIDSPPFGNQDITIGEVEDYIVGIDTIITAIRIDNNATLPKEFKLFQNYPNPFNPTTTIQYSVKTATDVKLEIFNILGQAVITLVDKFQNAGSFKAVVDFNKLTSGVYFYRIRMGNFVQSKKMILLK